MSPPKETKREYRAAVGRRIRDLRKKLDLSQEDVAGAITGSRDRQIGFRIEKGDRALSDDELPKVADLLQTTVEYIAKGQEPQQSTMYGLAESGASFTQPDLIPLVTYDDAGRHVEGYAERPPCLRGVRNGYAIYVWDECMEPCYSPGELLYINPVKPARAGRDVLILRRSGLPTFRRLERQDGKFIFVKAMTDANVARIPVDELAGVHLIVGTAEDK